MNSFNLSANRLLVETFNTILKYQQNEISSFVGTDITMSEVHTIEAVGILPAPVSVSDIATHLGITLPSATVAVQKLTRKGYVDKGVASSDARKTQVWLTQDGQEIYNAHNLFHQDMIQKVSEGLSEVEKQILLTAFEKLNSFFRASS